MARVLVTGGAGYIGSVLVPMLIERGHRVTVIDRLFFGKNRLADHPELEIVQDDVRRLEISDFVGFDVVIDLAAISNDPSSELFEEATWAINHRARVRGAQLAKQAGVSRYILPSTCSVYGFQDADSISDELSPTNPLTTYAKANLAAEEGVLRESGDTMSVTVIRQATVYGLSPRMRFDLAINGMTYGAWRTRRLPLMRDGSQWRPMVHVRDTSDAMCFLIDASPEQVDGEIFNVGSEDNVYQIGPLGDLVADAVPGEVDIEWYGDPDHRSYRVSFEKIEKLGWKAKRTARDGVSEIVAALEAGSVDKTIDTITLDWYRSMSEFQLLIEDVAIDGYLLDLPEQS